MNIKKSKGYNMSSLTLREDDNNVVSQNEQDDNDTNANARCSIYVNSTRKHRTLVSFWLFGLCNNFAYVVMLSAAHDILHDEENSSNGTHGGNSTNYNVTTQAPDSTNYLVCNRIGTGAILLADILPTLFVKLIFPFFLQQIPYNWKIILVALFGAASFVIVAFAHEIWLSVIGVVSASIGAGLGEITFLSLTTFYHRDVVSSWSSGTGGAGVLGALVYAGFTSLGLSPRTSLLIMLIVPVIMIVMFFFVLPPPSIDIDLKKRDGDQESQEIMKTETNSLTYREKFQLIPSLFKYMIPLSLVYFAEYFINQGLHELLYFNHQWLSRKEQYRWFQVDYQIGVFISRSSVNFFQIRKLWLLPILQFANMALLTCQVYYRFIPSLWLIMIIVFWEGLLGGAAYVNTFYRMTNELSSHIKEFCIGVATLGDSIGIAIAGSVAIPFHNHICDLKLKM